MKRFFTISALAFFALLAITVSGCTSPEVKKKVRYKYPAELIPSQHAYVKSCDIYQDGDGLILTGKVKRSVRNCCAMTTGHVDIMLVGPDGNIVDFFITDYRPGNIPKTASRASTFRVRLPFIPPEGTTVRARFHDKRLQMEHTELFALEIIECRRNISEPPTQQI